MAQVRAPRFYADLHVGGATIQLDFAAPEGRAELLRLAGKAGVIVGIQVLPRNLAPGALRKERLGADDMAVGRRAAAC